MTITRIGQLTAETQSLSDFLVPGLANLDPPTISTTKVRGGVYSYRIGGGTQPFGLGFTARSSVRSSFYLNHNGLASTLLNSRPKVLAFQIDSLPIASGHYVQWQNNTANLELYIANVLEDSISVASTGFSTVDRWFHLGAVVLPTGIRIYLDGTQILSWAGNPGNIVAAYVGGNFSSSITTWANYAYFDDIYIDDVTGESFSAPVGRRFFKALPNAVGNDANYTPVGAATNWECVDETPDDGDSTYVNAASPGLKDTYNFASLAGLPASYVIHGVNLCAVARKTVASDVKLVLNAFDGLTYEPSAELVLTTGYKTYVKRYANQNDLSSWNLTDFNAYQFGVESAGAFA